MGWLIGILAAIYALSVLGLSVAYGNTEMDITVWSVLSLIIPIVNTVILFYMWNPVSSDFKAFIHELKERRRG